MMKGILIGLLTGIISYATYGQTTEQNIKPDTQVNWESLSENNYSIQYPDNWVLNQAGQMGTSFVLFSQQSSEQDQFKENVNLIIQDLSGYDIDLDKYVEISEGQINTMITDSNIIESERNTRNALDFQKVVYTGKQGVLNLKFEQYYWVEDEKAYVLTFTAEENQFDAYKTTGEKILNSFEFLDN